jgi:hypothetical protein
MFLIVFFVKTALISILSLISPINLFTVPFCKFNLTLMTYLRLYLAYDLPSSSTAASTVFKNSRDETSLAAC